MNRIFVPLLAFFILSGSPLSANEPITPLPKNPSYNKLQADLGKRLFFDPLLSKDQTVSCASCHSPQRGGADGRALSTGVGGKQGNMNAPTVFNSSLNIAQFWNGRAKDLAAQALGPIQNPVEMNLSLEELLKRLKRHATYPKAFTQVFGSGEITTEKVALAIAEFEKALISPNSRFDRYLRGELKLSAEEQAGYKLFKSSGCISCHNGALVGGNSFQRVGVVNSYEWHAGEADLFAVTGLEQDKNRFKVPSLRMAASTAPYFHNGKIVTLEAAIITMGYYNLGVSLGDKEVHALKKFIESLQGERPAILEEP